MLELSGLTRRYDDFTFGPVDLSVGTEVLSVLGPSGSGKTTLLSLVAGIQPPDDGSVALDGRVLDGRPMEDRRTGLVFQEGALFPHMTARENVAYAASDPDRVDDLAARLELTSVLDRRPASLSGGERQRVALARTLAADPDALLLDEPLSSLDAPIRRRLRDELHDLFSALDVPVVYVTHDQRTATALGDRVAVFRDGAVEQVGSPADVLERPATPFVAGFTGTENTVPATVAERRDDGVTLALGEATLRAGPGAGPSDEPATAVTACIHPARVGLARPDETVPTGTTALAGTVERCLRDGHDVRVAVALDAAPVTLLALASASTVQTEGFESGRAVRVTIPPDAIHLVTDGRDG